jgi:hypothetical protein
VPINVAGDTAKPRFRTVCLIIATPTQRAAPADPIRVAPTGIETTRRSGSRPLRDGTARGLAGAPRSQPPHWYFPSLAPRRLTNSILAQLSLHPGRTRDSQHRTPRMASDQLPRRKPSMLFHLIGRRALARPAARVAVRAAERRPIRSLHAVGHTPRKCRGPATGSSTTLRLISLPLAGGS